jgi:hypothetical protein
MNDFVAEHAVADVDLAGRGSRQPNHFVLDDGGFADPRLRVSGVCRKPCSQAKRGDTKNAVTPVHFITDRLSRHRTGSRALTML